MSTTGEDQIVCPGCDGNRVQVGKDGIKVRCPVCGGSGRIYREPGVRVTY